MAWVIQQLGGFWGPHLLAPVTCKPGQCTVVDGVRNGESITPVSDKNAIQRNEEGTLSTVKNPSEASAAES
jgi:hypothetical protein